MRRVYDVPQIGVPSLKTSTMLHQSCRKPTTLPTTVVTSGDPTLAAGDIDGM